MEWGCRNVAIISHWCRVDIKFNVFCLIFRFRTVSLYFVVYFSVSVFSYLTYRYSTNISKCTVMTLNTLLKICMNKWNKGTGHLKEWTLQVEKSFFSPGDKFPVQYLLTVRFLIRITMKLLLFYVSLNSASLRLTSNLFISLLVALNYQL